MARTKAARKSLEKENIVAQVDELKESSERQHYWNNVYKSNLPATAARFGLVLSILLPYTIYNYIPKDLITITKIVSPYY
jgi:hypothetical protein